MKNKIPMSNKGVIAEGVVSNVYVGKDEKEYIDRMAKKNNKKS